MLYLEKKNCDNTVKIKMRNRLFYMLVLDGLSMEEAGRLWRQLADYTSDVLDDGCEQKSHLNFTHYFWWKQQKIAVLLITGDALDRLNNIGKNVNEFVNILDDFEEEQVHIPHVSINAFNFTSGKNASNKVASRVSINTDDKTGEVSVQTFTEIFEAAFRV